MANETSVSEQETLKTAFASPSGKKDTRTLHSWLKKIKRTKNAAFLLQNKKKTQECCILGSKK